MTSEVRTSRQAIACRVALRFAGGEATVCRMFSCSPAVRLPIAHPFGEQPFRQPLSASARLLLPTDACSRLYSASSLRNLVYLKCLRKKISPASGTEWQP